MAQVGGAGYIFNQDGEFSKQIVGALAVGVEWSRMKALEARS